MVPAHRPHDISGIKPKDSGLSLVSASRLPSYGLGSHRVLGYAQQYVSPDGLHLSQDQVLQDIIRACGRQVC